MSFQMSSHLAKGALANQALDLVAIVELLARADDIVVVFVVVAVVVELLLLLALAAPGGLPRPLRLLPLALLLRVINLGMGKLCMKLSCFMILLRVINLRNGETLHETFLFYVSSLCNKPVKRNLL